MDKSTTIELIDFILESILLIEKRFTVINTIDDFLKDDNGLEKLDSISMRLQSIGEALKNLYKRDKDFLLQEADSRYWSEIIKTRDFISHHYLDLDAETVFDICTNELQELNQKVKRLKNRLI